MAEAEKLASQMRASLNLHKRRKLTHDADTPTTVRASRSMSSRRRILVEEIKRHSLHAVGHGATPAYVEDVLKEAAEQERLPQKPAYGRFFADEINEYPEPEFYDPSAEAQEYYARTEWIRKREKGVIQKRKADNLDEAEVHAKVQQRVAKKRRAGDTTCDSIGRSTTARLAARTGNTTEEQQEQKRSHAPAAEPEPKTKSRVKRRAAEDGPDAQNDFTAPQRKKSRIHREGSPRPSSQAPKASQQPPSPTTTPTSEAGSKANAKAQGGTEACAGTAADPEPVVPPVAPTSAAAETHTTTPPDTAGTDTCGKPKKRTLSDLDDDDARLDTGRRKIAKIGKKRKRGVVGGKEEL